MSHQHPFRLVAYTDAAGVGGAEISLGHLVSAVSDDIEVTIVGVDQAVVETIAANRPQSTSIVLPSKGIGAFMAHRQTFQRLRPDVIHCNLCTPWACAIGLTAALSLPHIRVTRTDQLPLRTTDAIELWRTRALCLRVDAHVAVGEASARRMEDFYALGRDSVVSIPNCVPDVAAPELPEIRLDRPMVVGSIGRLDAMKAHDVLLRAIAQVEGVNVVILGEGEQRQALEQLAVQLGIHDRVELRGWVNNPRDHLPEFDVMALPSRSEGFPLTIVEAMLAARPVIATRVGSVPEAVIDGKTGFLIEKNDVESLAQAIRQLRDQPNLRQQLGQQGREVAVQRFTVQQMSQRYEDLWQNVMASPRSPRLRVPRPRD